MGSAGVGVAWRVDCDEETEQPEEDGRDAEQAEGEPVGDLRLLKNPTTRASCTQARDDTPHRTLTTLPATLPTALARGSPAHAVARDKQFFHHAMQLRVTLDRGARALAGPARLGPPCADARVRGGAQL